MLEMFVDCETARCLEDAVLISVFSSRSSNIRVAEEIRFGIFLLLYTISFSLMLRRERLTCHYQLLLG